MRDFKSLAEVRAYAFAHPSHTRVVTDAVRTLVDAMTSSDRAYDPENDGHVTMVERGDTVADVERALGAPLADVPWEGVTRDRGCFVGVVLSNNQYGRSFIFVDAWLPEELRQSLLAHLA